MLRNNNKIKTILVAAGLILTTQVSYAQVYAQFPDCEGSYTSTHQSYGCDQNVWNAMCAAAKAKSDTVAPVLAKMAIKDQAAAAPENPARDALKCLQGATSKIKSMANQFQGIYNKIIGLANGAWEDAANGALDQLSNMACRTVDSYVGKQITSATSPIMSSVTSLPGQAAGSLNGIQTPVGTLNAGNILLNDATKAGGSTGSWGNAVGGVLK